MAIVVENVISTIIGTGLTNLLTPVGQNQDRKILVLLSIEDALGGGIVNSISFNGTPMNLELTHDSGTTFLLRNQIYSLGESSLPAAGSYNLSLDTTLDSAVISFIELSGASDEPPESTAVNDDGQAGALSLTTNIITLTNESLIIDIFGSGAPVGDIVPTGGQNEQIDLNSGVHRAAVGSLFTGGAGAFQPGWTITSGASNRLNHIVAAYKPADQFISIGMGGTGVASGSTLSFTITIDDGPNRAVVVTAGARAFSAAGNTFTSVTFNGVAMTEVVTQTSGAFFGVRSSIFVLFEDDLPGAGTYTVTITTSSALETLGAGVELHNVEQSVPTDQATNSFSSSSTDIFTPILVDNEETVLIDAFTSDPFSSPAVGDAGQTGTNISIASFFSNTQFNASYKYSRVSGSNSMGWSFPGGQNRGAHVILAIPKFMNKINTFFYCGGG